MSYHFERNRHNPQSFLKYIASGIFVALLVIVITVFGVHMQRIATMARSISTEVLTTAVTLATPKSILLARQEALVAQNQELSQKLLGMQLLEDENNSLRTILSYPKLATTSITARVIARPSQSLYDRIVIDQGSDDGIAVGDRVIAGENALIGTIDKVSAHSAQAALISGSFFSGDAALSRLGITVPMTGKGSGNFELHVPRDMDVRDGDLITLPGAPDLVVGVIKTVQFDQRDPFQTVLARTSVNIQELSFVRVIE